MKQHGKAKLGASIVAAATFAALLNGCGSTDFTGSSAPAKAPKPAQEPPGSGDAVGSNPPTVDASGRLGVTWSWPCSEQTAAGVSPLASMIQGGGSFEADKSTAGYDIALAGELCAGATGARDVIFVLDGSSSMSGNDPYTAGTCGRLETLKTVMTETSKKGGARYAIIQFSSRDRDDVISSNGFHDDQAKLFAALSASQGGTPIGEIICDSNRLGTNYDIAYEVVEETITAGKAPGASVQIFMVSDGKPLFGADGAETATRLKQQGVVIGAVAVDGDPEVLRDVLASKDAQGQALFASVADAKGLTQAILGIAKRIPSGALLQYRAIGAQDWTGAALVTNGKDLKFTGPTIGFDQQSYPNGLEVEYAFSTSAGASKTVRGQVTWSK